MTTYVWRLYRHPKTEAVARVHIMDVGKARLYERWGWIELRGWL